MNNMHNNRNFIKTSICNGCCSSPSKVLEANVILNVLLSLLFIQSNFRIKAFLLFIYFVRATHMILSIAAASKTRHCKKEREIIFPHLISVRSFKNNKTAKYNKALSLTMANKDLTSSPYIIRRISLLKSWVYSKKNVKASTHHLLMAKKKQKSVDFCMSGKRDSNPRPSAWEAKGKWCQLVFIVFETLY